MWRPKDQPAPGLTHAVQGCHRSGSIFMGTLAGSLTLPAFIFMAVNGKLRAKRQHSTM
jgi:hypothetical protein